MCSTLDADFPSATHLTAFLCLFRRIVGHTTTQVDNEGIIDGLRRGEVVCIGPRANDADEEVRGIHREGTSQKSDTSQRKVGGAGKRRSHVGRGPDGEDKGQPFKREGRKFSRHCTTRLASIVWWKSEGTMKNLKPKDKWLFVDRQAESREHRTEWSVDSVRAKVENGSKRKTRNARGPRMRSAVGVKGSAQMKGPSGPLE